MQSHTLKRRTKRKTKRQVGRGGTRGKTSGRGTKGQNARAGRKKRPEIRDFIKRLPKLRGRGVSSLKSFKEPSIAVNLGKLDQVFKDGEIVTAEVLLAKRVIDANRGKIPQIKILGGGELNKKLTISGLAISAEARAKVEKAGGKIS